jgi:cytochrome c-type biogenesis protein CcmH/NrfG
MFLHPIFRNPLEENMKKINGFLALVLLLGWTVSVTAQDTQEQARLEAVKLNPKDATAHFNLGVVYFNKTRYEQAASEFEKCVQIDSKDNQAKELLESSRGFSAYAKNNYSEAAEKFKNTLKLNPQNPQANLLLGDCLTRLKKYKEAETAYQNSATNSPDNPEVVKNAYLGLAKIYTEREPKDYAKAAEALSVVVSMDPKNFVALQTLGFINFQSKNYKKAAEYWEKAVRIKKDAQIYKFLGFTYFNSGDFKDAIDNYNESIKRETAKELKEQNLNSLKETYYNLGVAYNDNGFFDEATEAFGQAFKLNPKDSDALVGQAQAMDAAVNAHMEKAGRFLVNSQYSDAILECKKVLKFQPENKQAQGFLDDAETKLGDEVEKHYAAGMAYYRSKETLKALTEWNAALEMEPNNAKCQAAIKKLKGKNTDKVKALVQAGDELYRQNDFAGANKKYAQARKISPSNKTVLSRLKKLSAAQTSKFDKYYEEGKGYLDEGRLKDAKKYLMAAQYIDPNNALVKKSLFMVQVRKGKKLEEAIELFERGDKNKAKEVFQEVLGVDPNNKKANDYIKKLTGKQSQAQVDAEKAKALYYEGVRFYLEGKIREAIEKWKECLAQDPNNFNAQNDIKKAEVKLQSLEKLNRN